MLHHISRDLNDTSEAHDFLTWLSHNKLSLKKYSFDKIAKLYKVSSACYLIRQEINELSATLPVTITQAPAFIALFENLEEFIANSIDAKADQVDLFIPDLPTIIVTLIYKDTGMGFKKEFLDGKERLDYSKKLAEKLNILSDKSSEELGGAGTGFGLSCHFLHDHHGTVTIGNQVGGGAHIELSSPPGNHQILNRKFHSLRRKIVEKVHEENLIEMQRKLEKETVEEEMVQEQKTFEENEEVKDTKEKPTDIPVKKATLFGISPLFIPAHSKSQYQSRFTRSTSIESDSSLSSSSDKENYSPKLFLTPKSSPKIIEKLEKQTQELLSHKMQ